MLPEIIQNPQHYRIIKNITISVIDSKGQDQLDYMMRPGDGEVWFNGHDIMYLHYSDNSTHTTINCNNFIEIGVEHGWLEKIEDEN
jgi:triacylglycerol esterase/lipase EstA (alpha/beta hydrolase family)